MTRQKPARHLAVQSSDRPPPPRLPWLSILGRFETPFVSSVIEPSGMSSSFGCRSLRSILTSFCCRMCCSTKKICEIISDQGSYKVACVRLTGTISRNLLKPAVDTSTNRLMYIDSADDRLLRKSCPRDEFFAGGRPRAPQNGRDLDQKRSRPRPFAVPA